MERALKDYLVYSETRKTMSLKTYGGKAEETIQLYGFDNTELGNVLIARKVRSEYSLLAKGLRSHRTIKLVPIVKTSECYSVKINEVLIGDSVKARMLIRYLTGINLPIRSKVVITEELFSEVKSS